MRGIRAERFWLDEVQYAAGGQRGLPTNRKDGPVAKDDVGSPPTGKQSVCLHCGVTIEEALFLKGQRKQDVDKNGRPVIIRSPGTPIWRTLDRGFEAALCPQDVQGAHHPTPGVLKVVSAR